MSALNEVLRIRKYRDGRRDDREGRTGDCRTAVDHQSGDCRGSRDLDKRREDVLAGIAVGKATAADLGR
jgi:hypothetical protein